jgi:hypothetical protein
MKGNALPEDGRLGVGGGTPLTDPDGTYSFARDSL